MPLRISVRGAAGPSAVAWSMRVHEDVTLRFSGSVNENP